MMKIEVVYAAPACQYTISVELPEKSSLLHAILVSNILEKCPEIDLDIQKTGIFGVISALETPLKENDRVEIYRPLPLDPILRRFERVRKERKKCG
jgi:putative ubiquitin-RnfH superfamily antitoxin RatB of RatAB toxin-antitoxin module